jgi:hypothetical protein
VHRGRTIFRARYPSKKSVAAAARNTAVHTAAVDCQPENQTAACQRLPVSLTAQLGPPTKCAPHAPPKNTICSVRQRPQGPAPATSAGTAATLEIVRMVGSVNTCGARPAGLNHCKAFSSCCSSKAAIIKVRCAVRGRKAVGTRRILRCRRFCSHAPRRPQTMASPTSRGTCKESVALLVHMTYSAILSVKAVITRPRSYRNLSKGSTAKYFRCPEAAVLDSFCDQFRAVSSN